MKIANRNSLTFYDAGHEAKISRACRGFTLIELLVVIAIIAILAAILLPVLASAKLRAQRAQDMNNIKQVAAAMFVFCGDHNDTFAAAGWENGQYQISWDSQLYPYMGGGNQPSSTMQDGILANNPEDAATLGFAPGLKLMVCPFDKFPKTSWMTTASGTELTCAVKDYEMVSCGEGQGFQGANNLIQRDPKNGLPSITAPGFLGVGIYWNESGATTPNWSILGFPENVVRHPTGTIMFAEEANSQGAEGNIWPCICCGPIIGSGTAWGGLYQIDTQAPQDAATLETSSSGYSEGLQLYQAQRNRFEYAFHDGHVESLQYQRTMGPTRFATQPGGMWSIWTAN